LLDGQSYKLSSKSLLLYERLAQLSTFIREAAGFQYIVFNTTGQPSGNESGECLVLSGQLCNNPLHQDPRTVAENWAGRLSETEQ
jgi:Tfp pilus assembly protein FimT